MWPNCNLQIISGYNSGPGYFSGFYSYNVSNNSWTKLTPSTLPTARSESVSIYDPNSESMWI